jgi:hypothetical protein
MPPAELTGGARAVWELLWYSGIAGAMLVLILMIVKGRLVPEIHHNWVIDALSKDRDEWREHSKSLQLAFDRLVVEMSQGRGRR